MSYIICPTILASSKGEYKLQMEKVKNFAKRIQIDLTDGDFTKGISLPLECLDWPANLTVDIHLMYRNPQKYVQTLLDLKPNMVIVQAESDCDIPKFASDLRVNGIRTGVCLLQDTSVESAAYIFPHVQHMLVFSGILGYFGGKTDLSLTTKISQAKAIHKYLEIGWDGGVNKDNAYNLVNAGVNVLNVGGAIQNEDDPEAAYATIKSSLNGL